MAMARRQKRADRSRAVTANGHNMIYQQLKNVLVEAGLEEVDASGKLFDPNLHEAFPAGDQRCAEGQ